MNQNIKDFKEYHRIISNINKKKYVKILQKQF